MALKQKAVAAAEDLQEERTIAAMRFDAWPEAVASIGSAKAWTDVMTEKARGIVSGISVLMHDDVALTQNLRIAGEEAVLQIADDAIWLRQQADAFRALARICDTAAVRVSCACTRVSLDLK